MTINAFFQHWLSQGSASIGEITIRSLADGSIQLHHQLDSPETDSLTSFNDPQDAREIAKYDEKGGFRPLKSAPTLKRGWLLTLQSQNQLRHALDYFYPAAVANWVQFHARGDQSVVVSLRETLNRQTGMYRVTALITDDEAQEMVAKNCCDAKCSRSILWPVSPEAPLQSLPVEKRTPNPSATNVPLLCCEACNILVAAARSVVKKRMSEAAKKAEAS